MCSPKQQLVWRTWPDVMCLSLCVVRACTSVRNKKCPWPCCYLLTQRAVAKVLQAIELVGLAQKGVEGLGCPVDRGGVGWDREGSDQAHLLQGGVAASRLVQELMILQVLCETLQHRQRLVEVYLSGRMKGVRDTQSKTGFLQQEGGSGRTRLQAWEFWRAPCRCSSSWCSTSWGSSWAYLGHESASVCGAAAPSLTHHYSSETSGSGGGREGGINFV